MTADIKAIKKELDRLNRRFYKIWEEEGEVECDLLEEMGEDFDELYDLMLEARDGSHIVRLGEKHCILATEFFSSDFDFDEGLPSVQDFRIVPDNDTLEFYAYYRDDKINPLLLVYDIGYFFENDAKAFGKVVAYLLNEPNLYLITEYNK